MSDIQSVMHENRVFTPSADFVKQANDATLRFLDVLSQRITRAFGDVWRVKRCNGKNRSPRR